MRRPRAARLARSNATQQDRPDHMHWLWDFGPQSYDEGKFADYTDASWTIERLEEEHDRPFFLALGFYRPHVPFFPPERLYNHPDLSGELRLPLVRLVDGTGGGGQIRRSDGTVVKDNLFHNNLSALRCGSSGVRCGSA